MSNLVEKIQDGYFLSDDTESSISPQSIRNMGFINTTILRLILNCTLYLSSYKSNVETAKILNSSLKVSEGNLSAFFFKQIRRNIKTLSNCIQYSPDETLLFIHFILNQFKVSKEKATNYDGYLKKKEDRQRYEDIFCR